MKMNPRQIREAMVLERHYLELCRALPSVPPSREVIREVARRRGMSELRVVLLWRANWRCP